MNRHTVTATESGIYMPGQQSLYNTAHACLLTPYGLDDRQLDDVFAQIMTHQVDYADLYFQYSRAEGWSLEEGIVKSGSFNIDQGVGVRAVAGEKTAFAYVPLVARGPGGRWACSPSLLPESCICQTIRLPAWPMPTRWPCWNAWNRLPAVWIAVSHR